jgi:hypothetical protein
MAEERISFRTVGATLLVSALAVALIDRLPVETSGNVAAVFPPWVDGAAVVGAVTAAGGLLVSSTFTPSTIVAQSDRRGFVARLYAAGAVLVVATGAPGCMGISRTP